MNKDFIIIIITIPLSISMTVIYWTMEYNFFFVRF